MKFNYEKFPILSFLNEPNRVELNVPTEEYWEWLTPDTPVQYLTKPFLLSVMRFADNLIEVFPTIAENIPDRKGVYLLGNQFVFYKVVNKVINFSVGSGLTEFGRVRIEKGQIYGIFAEGVYEKKDNETDKDWWAKMMIVLFYFLDNCEVETKMITAKSERTIGLDRYLNQTRSNVGVINCTWFTTLVSNIPHGVTGHFRWQPFGEGRAQRKLIWIQDFIRNGFTRRARVLTQQK